MANEIAENAFYFVCSRFFTTRNGRRAFIFRRAGASHVRPNANWQRGEGNFRQPNGVDWFPVTDI